MAGLTAGVAARVATRIVELAANRLLSFTVEGTLLIMAMCVILGVAPGLLDVTEKNHLPGFRLLKGIVFGMFLIFALGFSPLVLRLAMGELAIGPPLLGRGLFAALSVVFGLAVAGAESMLVRVTPFQRRSALFVGGFGLLALASVSATFLFIEFVLNVYFGIKLVRF